MALTIREIHERRSNPMDFVQIITYICECGDTLPLQIRTQEPEGMSCRKVCSICKDSFFEGNHTPTADISIFLGLSPHNIYLTLSHQPALVNILVGMR
jgi:hypothetical protein